MRSYRPSHSFSSYLFLMLIGAFFVFKLPKKKTVHASTGTGVEVGLSMNHHPLRPLPQLRRTPRSCGGARPGRCRFLGVSTAPVGWPARSSAPESRLKQHLPLRSSPRAVRNIRGLQGSAYARGSNRDTGSSLGGGQKMGFMNLYDEDDSDEDDHLIENEYLAVPRRDRLKFADDGYISSLEEEIIPIGKILVIKSPKDEMNPLMQRALDGLYDLNLEFRYVGLNTRWSRGASTGPSVVAVSSTDSTIIWDLPAYMNECQLLCQPFPPPSLTKVLMAPVIKASHGGLHDVGNLWKTWKIDSMFFLDTSEIARAIDSPNIQRERLVAAFLNKRLKVFEKEPDWSKATHDDYRQLAGETQATLLLLDEMINFMAAQDQGFIPTSSDKTSGIMLSRQAEEEIKERLLALFAEQIAQLSEEDTFSHEGPSYKAQMKAWKEVKSHVENEENREGDDYLWANEAILESGIYFVDIKLKELDGWEKQRDQTETLALLPQNEYDATEVMKALEPLPPRLPKRIKHSVREMMRIEVNQLLKDRENQVVTPQNYHPLLKLNKRICDAAFWLTSLDAMEHPRWRSREARDAAMECIIDLHSRFKKPMERVILTQQQDRDKSFILTELKALEKRMSQSMIMHPSDTLSPMVNETPRSSRLKILEAIRDYLEDKNIESRPPPWNEASCVTIAIELLDSQIATVSLGLDNESGESVTRTETPADYTWMTIKELKVRLRERGLPVSGSKATLIDRLTEAYYNENGNSPQAMESAQDVSSGGDVDFKDDLLNFEDGSSSATYSSHKGSMPVEARKCYQPFLSRKSIFQTRPFDVSKIFSRRTHTRVFARDSERNFRFDNTDDEDPESRFDFDSQSIRGPPKKEDIQTYYFIERDRRAREKLRSSKEAANLDEDLDEYLGVGKDNWALFSGPDLVIPEDSLLKRDTTINETEMEELIKMFKEDVDNMEMVQREELYDSDDDESLESRPQSVLDPRVREDIWQPRNPGGLEKEKKFNSPDFLEDEEDVPDEVISEEELMKDLADGNGRRSTIEQKIGENGEVKDLADGAERLNKEVEKLRKENEELRKAIQASKQQSTSLPAQAKGSENNSKNTYCKNNSERLSGGGPIPPQTRFVDSIRGVGHSFLTAGSQTNARARSLMAMQKPVEARFDEKLSPNEGVGLTQNEKAGIEDSIGQGDEKQEAEEPEQENKPGVLQPYKRAGERIEQKTAKYLNEEIPRELSIDEKEPIPDMDPIDIDDPNLIVEAPEEFEYDDPEGVYTFDIDTSVVRKEPWYDQEIPEPIPRHLYSQLRIRPRDPLTKKEIKRVVEMLTRRGYSANQIKTELVHWYYCNAEDVTLPAIHQLRKAAFPKGEDFGEEPRDSQPYITWNVDWKASEDIFFEYEQPPPFNRLNIAPFLKDQRYAELEEQEIRESYRITSQKEGTHLKKSKGGSQRKGAESLPQGDSRRKGPETIPSPKSPGRVPSRFARGRGGGRGGLSAEAALTKTKGPRGTPSTKNPNQATNSPEIQQSKKIARTSLEPKSNVIGSNESGARRNPRTVVDEDREEGETRSSRIVKYDRMTVVNLKETLKDRGLPTSGRKRELIERLILDDSTAGS